MSPQKKNPKAKPNSLEAVALRELGIKLNKEHQTDNWGGELSLGMIEYAAKDVQVLLPLAEIFESKIEDAGLVRTFKIEHRALPAMVWMKNAGVHFDPIAWEEYLKQVEHRIDGLKEKLAELAPDRPEGGGWNWNSPQQTKKAFALVGINLPNTKAETLSQYNHPLAKLLLEFRKASKMVSSFGPGLLGFVGENDRIYADWRQIGTETGRMSCSKPNLQQLPPEVRRHVRAPKGCVLVWADYSQAEIRILAAASDDPTLVEAFRAGKDPYKATAANMFGIPEEEVTEEQRSMAKVLNFSFIFGATPFGIARKLRISEHAARRLATRYFAAHPNVANFLKTTVQQALDTGEARTLTGRVRRFGDVSAKSDKEKRQVMREAMNLPMQGSCADGLKRAEAFLYERRHECPGAVLIIALHDELVVECDEKDVEAAAAWLEQAMIDGMAEVLALGASGDLRVPVEVEIKWGKTWDGSALWSPLASEYTEEEKLSMSNEHDDNPVLVKLYIDYRDSSVDNYPQIEVCEECAETLNGDLEEQDDLQPGEAAWCVECGIGNAAAGDC